jgi:rfaE bifunctional protein kinase chain/domain
VNAMRSSREPKPPRKAELLEMLRAFAGRRVLVWADLGVDRYLWGAPKRVSREAPVLILGLRREWWVPGGGGNAVMNLKAMGGEPIPVGAVGADEDGDRLLECFRQRRISVRHIQRIRGYRTVSKTRVLAGPETGVKQQVVRFDREEPLPEGVRIVPDGALRAGALVVSDYGYSTVAPAALARARVPMPVVVASRFRLPEFPGVAAVTPNEEEAAAAAGLPIASDADAEAAGRKILRSLKAGALLMTRGSRGVLLMEPRRPPRAMAAHGGGEVADTTGAGDTVLAAFALGLASGFPTDRAAFLANIAGALKVRKLGTATVSVEELRHEIETAL